MPRRCANYRSKAFHNRNSSCCIASVSAGSANGRKRPIALAPILGEFGITLPKGLHKLRERLPWVLEDAESGLPDHTRLLVHERYSELLHLDDRIDWVTRELERTAQSVP